MVVWVFVISIILFVISAPLIAVGAYQKYKNENTNEMYYVMFILGCIIAGFGLFMFILSFMADNMEKSITYMNYFPKMPNQVTHNSFSNMKESMFPPIYQNFGLSMNPE